MITSIRLVNFKNFADETLRVGPFTVIVGANANGERALFYRRLRRMRYNT